jgi:biopolymer transport protein ExbD
MKFPRNARIFRGRLDAAPLASVFFLLVIFIMLGSLVRTPGVRLQLPEASDLPGTDRPTIAVAIDTGGLLYFQNQRIERDALRERLRQAAKTAPEPLTLVVQADKKVTCEMLMDLTLLARESGITNGLLATLPRPFSTRASRPSP